MSDWYCSSAAYGAIDTWQAGLTMNIGDLVIPVAPTQGARFVFRASAITTGITAGSQPSWPTANNGTVVDGGVTWTNVTGQSAYGWSAAAGDHGSLYVGSRMTLYSRMFVSSDHAEVITGATVEHHGASTSTAAQKKISVNRGGSVPPTSIDLLDGASFATFSGSLFLGGEVYYQGVTLHAATTLFFNNTDSRSVDLDDCKIVTHSATGISTGNVAITKWQNTTVKFASLVASIRPNSNALDLEWLDTPAAIDVAGTIPTALFTGESGNLAVTCRGVDFSALGSGKKLLNATLSSGYTRILLDSCLIDPAVTRIAAAPGSPSVSLELVNCSDGNATVNERYGYGGAVTTERSITLHNGANDGAPLSHKLVSTSQVNDSTVPLSGFVMDMYNSVIDDAQTATVQIVSEGGLTDGEIWLDLEYYPTVDSNLAQFITTKVPTLGTAATLPASTDLWDDLPPTPVKQEIVATFLAQTPGRLRGVIRLGAVSSTVYYDPIMTLELVVGS